MDIRLIRDILYNRNQAGLIALSQFLLKNHREIMYGRDMALMGDFMFSVEKVNREDAEVMNAMMAVLPNFIFTFNYNLREFLDGPFLHEIENPSEDITIEILIQLSFAYNAIDRRGNDKVPRVKLLYRDRDLSYVCEHKGQGYRVKPSFLAIVPTLTTGDLSKLVPSLKVVGTPVDNLLELVSRDDNVRRVFDRIVEKVEPSLPVLESPKYILAKLNGEDIGQCLDGITACVSSKEIRDIPSALYYRKVLSGLPSSPGIDNLISRLEVLDPNTALFPGLRFEKLTTRYIDDLLPITTDIETMKYIGKGELWNREKLSDKTVESETYYNWVIIYNDDVVGYAGLHPMIDNQYALQLRILVGKNHRGHGFGVEAVKFIMSKQYTELPYKILGVVNKTNNVSIKMMEKAGLKQLGEIKIRGNPNIVFGTEQREYNDTFILDSDNGFQYEKLKIQLSKHGIKEAVHLSPRPKFNWGSSTYCEMNSCLDGGDFITDRERLYHAIKKYFPDVPLPVTTALRTIKLYMVASMLNGRFKVHVWNKAELNSHTIDNINIFLTTELATQLRVILSAVAGLLYKSTRVSKKSKWGFQIFEVELAVYPDVVDTSAKSSLALLKVKPYTDYQYGTAGLNYSNGFFDWLNEAVIVPFVTNGQSRLRSIYDNMIEKFGFYGTDYATARRELPDLIDYPYLHLYTRDSDIIRYFNMLKTYKYKTSDEQYRFHNIQLPPSGLKFQGRYHRIISSKSEATNIGSMSDYFAEDIRVHCKFLSNMSIYQYYNENFSSLIDTLQKEDLPATIEELRELLWKHKQCTTFKPKIMKYIVEMFKARKVLDISSGWGDRLIGAMASDMDFYHGFDPNVKLASRYLEIINFFKPFAVNPSIVCSVESLPFEMADLQSGFYDLVMSSPPYFTMEIYDETGEGQSTVGNPSEIDWYTNYLSVWVKKCYHALQRGGILALNINQEKGKHYVEWLLRDNSTPESGFAFSGTIGYSNEDGRNPQPIFIFKKV